jgi:sulfur dioxygenase
MHIGLPQSQIAERGWALSAAELLGLLGQSELALVDLRERREREKHGCIPGSLHAPYGDLADHLRPGGMLYELASATNKSLVFYCAFGERSAMAVTAAQEVGLVLSRHLAGGMDAWKRAAGPVAHLRGG